MLARLRWLLVRLAGAGRGRARGVPGPARLGSAPRPAARGLAHPRPARRHRRGHRARSTGRATSRPSRRCSTRCGARSPRSFRPRSGCRSTATSKAARSIPGHFADDWNRTHVLEPDGPPVGAVVLLHGLTDAPYSGRHIGRALPRPGLACPPAPPARARHRAGGAHRRPLGGLAGRHPARGQGGAPPDRPRQADPPRGLLQRRRLGHAVRAGRAWRTRRCPGPTGWC